MEARDNLLDNLTVVLFGPKFSENVGAAARACANMGVSRLAAVAPRGLDPERAGHLATGRGREVLSAMDVYDSLETAVAGATAVYGTTARLGGWRSTVLDLGQAAAEMRDELAAGGRVAVVFGPEEAGLTNAETRLCGRLLTIPTAASATSLNLAQAVLVVLYEVFRTVAAAPAPKGPTPARAVSHAEREALFATLRETLLAIDFLKPDNPEYWMLPVRRFVNRVGLARQEYSLLMGVCRQMRWALGLTGREGPDGHGQGK